MRAPKANPYTFPTQEMLDTLLPPFPDGGFPDIAATQEYILQVYIQRGLLHKDHQTLYGLHEMLHRWDTTAQQQWCSQTLPRVIERSREAYKLLRFVVLEQNVADSLQFTKYEASIIVASMFLGTLEGLGMDDKFNARSLLPLLLSTPSQEVAKLEMIANYLHRVTTLTPVELEAYKRGKITISRQSCPSPLRLVNYWKESNTPLNAFHVHETGGIEDAAGALHADFANQYIGGGVIVGGCVQEEIRFAIGPELLTSMVFCPVMLPHEAIVIAGTEIYSQYQGYAFGLQYGGNHVDNTPIVDDVRQSVIVAIDAVPYHGSNSIARQLDGESGLLREVIKCFAGFYDAHPLWSVNAFPQGAATGNWGAGAFGGDAGIKSLVQWMALSEAGRPVQYYTFQREQLEASLRSLVQVVHDQQVTVGELWRALEQVAMQPLDRNPDIVALVTQVLTR